MMLITIPQEMTLDGKGTLAKSIRRVDERRVKHVSEAAHLGFVVC